MIVSPLTFLERLEAERLTEDNGFGLAEGEVEGWLTFTGLACPHRLWIARFGAHWLVGLAHAGAMIRPRRQWRSPTAVRRWRWMLAPLRVFEGFIQHTGTMRDENDTRAVS